MSDKQSEGEIVEEEEEEMDESENRKLDFVPTLTDQIHLLKPGFPMPSDPDTESESTLATFSNLTEPEITPAPTHGQASEKETTPAPTHGQASEETTPAPTRSQASEKDVSVESRRQGSAEPESKAAQEPSLHIPSSEPPWIEMVRGGEGGGKGGRRGGRGLGLSTRHSIHYCIGPLSGLLCTCVFVLVSPLSAKPIHCQLFLMWIKQCMMLSTCWVDQTLCQHGMHYVTLNFKVGPPDPTTLLT